MRNGSFLNFKKLNNQKFTKLIGIQVVGKSIRNYESFSLNLTCQNMPDPPHYRLKLGGRGKGIFF